jgi:hypothetical protein
MRDEGSQRCNLWIVRYFKFSAVEPREESLRVSTAQIIMGFGYQTFHVWLSSHRGSAAKSIRTQFMQEQKLFCVQRNLCILLPPTSVSPNGRRLDKSEASPCGSCQSAIS